jgi:hypothetical protein
MLNEELIVLNEELMVINSLSKMILVQCDSMCYMDKCRAPCSISFEEYVRRLWKTLDYDIEVFVTATIYLARLMSKIKKLPIFNVYKVFIAAVSLAGKFSEKPVLSNHSFSKIVGLNIETVKKLELEICTILDYDFEITKHTYNQFLVACNSTPESVKDNTYEYAKTSHY